MSHPLRTTACESHPLRDSTDGDAVVDCLGHCVSHPLAVNTALLAMYVLRPSAHTRWLLSPFFRRKVVVLRRLVLGRSRPDPTYLRC